MQAHHPEGPSLHPAFAECSCFQAQAEIDDLEAAEAESADEEAESATDAKARGTAQHTALALSIAGAGEWSAGLSRYEAKNVKWVAETVIATAEANGYSRADIICEQRVEVFAPDFSELCFGTLDIEFGPFVIDAKFGLERNYFPQLSAYALGRFQRDNTRRGYVGTVYGMLRRYVQQPITLETAQAVTWGIMARRHAAVRKPSPCSYCGWCALRSTCSAFTAPVLALMDASPDWRAMMARVEQLPLADRLGFQRYIWKEFLEPYGDRVTEEAKTNCETVPTGYKKSVQSGKSGVTDKAKAVAALRQAGVTDSDFLAVAEFSYSEMVAAYSHKYPQCSEQEARKACNEVLAGAGVFNPGKPFSKLTKIKGAEELIRSALT